MEPPCLPPPQSPAMTMARHGNPLDICVRLWHTTIYLRGTGLNAS